MINYQLNFRMLENLTQRPQRGRASMLYDSVAASTLRERPAPHRPERAEEA